MRFVVLVFLFVLSTLPISCIAQENETVIDPDRERIERVVDSLSELLLSSESLDQKVQLLGIISRSKYQTLQSVDAFSTLIDDDDDDVAFLALEGFADSAAEDYIKVERYLELIKEEHVFAEEVKKLLLAMKINDRAALDLIIRSMAITDAMRFKLVNQSRGLLSNKEYLDYLTNVLDFKDIRSEVTTHIGELGSAARPLLPKLMQLSAKCSDDERFVLFETIGKLIVDGSAAGKGEASKNKTLEYTRTMMSRYDRNKDGFLDEGEIRKMRRAPKTSADKNGDTRISFRELAFSYGYVGEISTKIYAKARPVVKRKSEAKVEK